MALAVVASPSDAELQRTLSALLSGVDWTTTTTGQVRALLSSKFNGVDLEHRKGLIVQQACVSPRSRARAQLLTLTPLLQINSFFQEANDYENKCASCRIVKSLPVALLSRCDCARRTSPYQMTQAREHSDCSRRRVQPLTRCADAPPRSRSADAEPRTERVHGRRRTDCTVPRRGDPPLGARAPAQPTGACAVGMTP